MWKARYVVENSPELFHYNLLAYLAYFLYRNSTNFTEVERVFVSYFCCNVKLVTLDMAYTAKQTKQISNRNKTRTF